MKVYVLMRTEETQFGREFLPGPCHVVEVFKEEDSAVDALKTLQGASDKGRYLMEFGDNWKEGDPTGPEYFKFTIIERDLL